MKLLSKFYEKFIEHVAEASIAAVSVLLIFAAKELSPIVLPLIESKLSNQTLLALFFASIAVNLVLAVLIYIATRKPDLKLKYGIYWDKVKNPYCPGCQNQWLATMIMAIQAKVTTANHVIKFFH